MNTIGAQLARLADARLRCIEKNVPNWKEIHTRTINKIMEEKMPHGSGIDGGNRFDFERSNGRKLIIHSSYHKMDENGMYDGWIDYNIVVTANLMFGLNVNIVGNFGRDYYLKEMLAQRYWNALEEEVVSNE